jgi:hypothetical protein
MEAVCWIIALLLMIWALMNHRCRGKAWILPKVSLLAVGLLWIVILMYAVT